MLVRVVTGLKNKGWPQTVISITSRDVHSKKLRELGIPVFICGIDRPMDVVGGLWRLFRQLRQTNTLLIQTWLYHADFFGLVIGRLARARKIAWNIRCSDLDLERYPLRNQLLMRLLAILSPFADAVVVNSKAGKRSHIGLGYRPKVWKLIQNGFPIDKFQNKPDLGLMTRRELSIGNSELLIGMVARYEPIKGHSNFFHAVRELIDRGLEIRILLVGRGIEARNTELAKELERFGLWKTVVLGGSRDDIPAVMSALDILTIPSAIGEGFPNVLGEAMACEVPCVVTDVGDCREIVGDTGLVVTAGNPDELADAIAKLIRMGAERRQLLGRNARRRIEENYSIDIILSEYEQFYLDLLAPVST